MGREAALQVLYAADVTSGIAPETVEGAYAAVQHEFSLPVKARERALELLSGVAQNLKQLDERISQVSANWKLHRLATVDRNILRVAAFELLFEPETPTEVIIDEAVEVARRFGGGSSPAFVNGVLDELARGREAPEA
jgi:N utilization substance protein B